MTTNFIGLVRVSTKNQGESKLGLLSQRAEIERWAAYNGYNLITVMEEVASGGLPVKERPILKAALALAKQMDAQVVVTKTDRCSRDVEVCHTLMQKKKLVMSLDLGATPDEFVGHIFAGLAAKERKMIGIRTKAGLAAAKARGVILGNRTNLKEAQALGTETQRQRANAFADTMKVTIQAYQKAGMTLKQIADELNAQETRTVRGGNWHTSTIRNVISRW